MAQGTEELIGDLVDRAVAHAVFGHRRDFLNKEADATHMLSPTPLAISMGVGSQATPYVMPAIENINGQAIALANKHKGVKSAADFKGFKLAVPFDYSMHNFLLRYAVAEAGLDPSRRCCCSTSRSRRLERNRERGVITLDAKFLHYKEF
jgi:hypothetical protein